MPRLIPESPTFTTASEREVWERLRDSLGADDVLLANLRLTDADKDVEADLVVLMPEVGILVLEVKGQDSQKDRAKRGYLAEWVEAVNEHGGFGRWAADVSLSPSDLPDILARHGGA